MRFKRIGRYDVTALIGEGGMGQAYRATDARFGRDMAMKFLGSIRVSQRYFGAFRGFPWMI